MKRAYLYLLASLFVTLGVSAQSAERKLAFDNYHRYYNEAAQIQDVQKEKAIKKYRDFYAEQAHRKHTMKPSLNLQGILKVWRDDGLFEDMALKEKEIMESKDQGQIGPYLEEAFTRVWTVAEEFRAERMGVSLDRSVFKKCQKAILYYGNLEVNRSNRVHRFHPSCFGMPTAAVNTYFSFLKQMDAVERGKSKDQELIDACDMLKVIGLQAWTQPLRHDATDQNVIQLDRFRNHVWWVGGNALAYRSLLQVAIMYKSIPMIDLLGEVAQRGLITLHRTYIKNLSGQKAVPPMEPDGDMVCNALSGDIRSTATLMRSIC